MADYGNVNHFAEIINRIDHAVIADAQPPEIFLAVKFDDAGWSRVFGQRFDLLRESDPQARREAAPVPCARNGRS